MADDQRHENTGKRKGLGIMQRDALFEQLPKGSISEIIIKRITDALITGDLKPGDKIPTEVEFSRKLGVSRNGVREAIKVLVAFGVLEIRRAEGTFVVEEYNEKLLNPMLYGMIFMEHSMEELLETKIAIATSTLYLALRNASDEDIGKLRGYGEQFRDAMYKKQADVEEIYQAGAVFQDFLGVISGNPMISHLDSVVCRIAVFMEHKAIEVSLERGIPHVLPNNVLEEVAILEDRDKDAVISFMDRRLKLWQILLL